MENQSLLTGLQWLGGGVVAILSVIGAGGLILAFLNRRWKQKDRNEEIHESNQTAQINAEVSLVQELLRRVATLERTQKEQGDKLMALTDTNARLDERNKALEKENTRLHEDLRDVKSENGKKGERIRELEKEVRTLQGQVAELMAIHLGQK